MTGASCWLVCTSWRVYEHVAGTYNPGLSPGGRCAFVYVECLLSCATVLCCLLCCFAETASGINVLRLYMCVTFFCMLHECRTDCLWDCRGCVTCLKLSPNLRKVSKPADEKQKVEDLEVNHIQHDSVYNTMAMECLHCKATYWYAI